ncbi:hypothetical protein [Bosea sp. PAMC 26642]|uniref:hypothetical protein n=1 Tax=Bosea sp. (strain PAMC 26642) TaxID=1792307 RepID=UPI00076FFC7B|nr:hypothetical protein [Bosea sp. PAMC 26642]AMJ60499.1 hypothetical protein AXW83_09550 [Bosea sp. PAMC 26642]
MAYFVPTEEQRADILESLAQVGRDKAIGYLPMPTVLKILRLTIPAVEREFANSDRSVLALSPDECCINGGAVYVFDQQALAALLRASDALLASLGWPTDNEGFVRKIAAEWLTADHPLIGLVREAFGDAHP